MASNAEGKRVKKTEGKTKTEDYTMLGLGNVKLLHVLAMCENSFARLENWTWTWANTIREEKEMSEKE